METNKEEKVVISLQTYNELRDFKEMVLKNDCVRVNRFSIFGKTPFVQYEIITKDETIKKLIEESNKIRDNFEKNINIAIEIHKKELLESFKSSFKLKLSKIKKMSIWQFIKFRKLTD